MIHILKRYIRNLSIQTKLLCGNLCVCAACLIMLWCIGIPQITRLSEQNILYSSQLAREQAQEYLAFRMETLRQATYSFSYSKAIITAASNSFDKESSAAFTEQLHDKSELAAHIRAIYLNYPKLISGIRLYLNDSFLYVSKNANTYLPFSQILETPWYQVMEEKGYAAYFIPPVLNSSSQAVSSAHLISSPNDYSKCIGAVVVDTPLVQLESILQNCSVTPHSYSYLINDEGILIAASNADLFVPAPQNIWAELTQSNSFSTDSMLYFSHRLDSCGWTLVQALPTSDIAKSKQASLTLFVIACIAILAICILLSAFISSAITRRVSRLSSAMRSFCFQKVPPLLAPASGDEIDYLLISYNAMVTELSALSQENNQKEQQLVETELALLHTQINPHLLFNTLDMIRVLALDDGAEKAAEAAGALSVFYQNSLGRSSVWCTLQDELDYIYSYMEIQKLRFEHRVQLQVDVDAQWLDINLPRIILQPIVENALVHGIMEQEDWSGIIRISGRVQGEDFLLSVHDNGRGIPSKELSTLLQSRPATHIGLWNTNERIRMHYGASYGLTVHSTEGEYTEVVLRIKVLRGKG